MKRALVSAGLLALFGLGLASEALAVGHYEMVWFRQWNRWQCGMNAGQVQVWVFHENGYRMGSVEIRDHNGAYPFGGYAATPPNGEKCEIVLNTAQPDIGVQCYDGTSTSDISPIFTSAYGGDWGHYVYEVGFVYKPNGSSPGDADSTVFGVVPTRTNNSDDNPYTASMVYANQYWPQYFLSQDPAFCQKEDLMPNSAHYHQQTFVATGVDHLLGVYAFPVQPGNAPTQWGVEIKYGGPDGPVIYNQSLDFKSWFEEPMSFPADACPVIPGQTYTMKLISIDPYTCNVYYVPGTYYAGGDYYWGDTLNPPDPDASCDPATKDMFGFVWGWDAGVTNGMIIVKVVDSKGNPISLATATLSGGPTPGQKTSTTYGVCVFDNLGAGTYTIDVDRPGYEPETVTGNVVSDLNATVVTVQMSTSTEDLTNGSFEMGEYAWTTYGTNPPTIWDTPAGGVPSNGDKKMLASMAPALLTAAGGAYQQASTLAGESYQAVFNAYTSATNVNVRIGVDLTGGTNPLGGTIIWSSWSNSPDAWSTDADANKKLSFDATGAQTTVFVEYSATNMNRIAAMDNVRLYRLTGPAPTADRDLDAGWSLVSASLVDSLGEPVPNVFDQAIAAGNSLQGNLHAYDTGSGTYDSYSADFTDAEEALGYWVDLTVPVTEGHSNPQPADPVSVALANGWNLIGQPHQYGTPLAGLVFDAGPIPAWHDIVNSKMKYRSDNTGGVWNWVIQSETVLEWGVYVKNKQYTDQYPRIRFRETTEYDFSYEETRGWWNLPGTRVTGGILAGGAYRVVMPPDSWHTVRAYMNTATGSWSITIDGLTDNAHHATGIATPGSGTSGYVQWGVLSSDKHAEFYTSHIYWGQNAEIDNWPVSKMYNAYPNGLGPEIPVGGFLGWRTETNNVIRSYDSVGANELAMADAVDAGWVEGAAVGYDNGYTIVKEASGDAASLEPWNGYWLKVNQPGLTLKIPAPAVAAAGTSDEVSSVRLITNAPGCITSSFVASVSPTATEGYEATHDVTAPPAGPPGQKEVVFGTELNSQLMVMDARPEGWDFWEGTMQAVGFDAAECQTVTVTWDLDDAGDYPYALVDVDAEVATVMTPGGQYTFQICQNEALPFEIAPAVYPPPLMAVWRSVNYHGDRAVSDYLSVALDHSKVGPNDATTEPRAIGITLIEVDFDWQPGTHTPGQVILEGGLVQDGPDSLVDNGDGTFTLVIPVTGSAPLTCYRIDISNSVSHLLVDADCYVATCNGDGNDNRQTDALDRGAVKVAELAGRIATWDPRLDINTDGVIDALDRGAVKVRELALDKVTCP